MRFLQTGRKLARVVGAGIFTALGFSFCHAAQAQEPVMQCIQSASSYHHVNANILTAIVMVESSMRPNVVNYNRNGTVDLGMTGINSMHIHQGMQLARFGIGRQDLSRPCISIFVGAWHLAQQIQRFGNTWYAIGAYHSLTPRHNREYQVRVVNALKAMGVR